MAGGFVRRLPVSLVSLVSQCGGDLIGAAQELAVAQGFQDGTGAGQLRAVAGLLRQRNACAGRLDDELMALRLVQRGGPCFSARQPPACDGYIVLV